MTAHQEGRAARERNEPRKPKYKHDIKHNQYIDGWLEKHYELADEMSG